MIPHPYQVQSREGPSKIKVSYHWVSITTLLDPAKTKVQPFAQPHNLKELVCVKLPSSPLNLLRSSFTYLPGPG